MRLRTGALVAALLPLSACGAHEPRTPVVPRASAAPRLATPARQEPATRGASVRQRALGMDFAVFRRPRTAADAVPHSKPTVRFPGGSIYLSESRRIASAEGKSAWLAPADKGVCLVFSGAAGREGLATITCRTLTQTRRGELFAVQPGPPAFVQGAVVDRVAAVRAPASEQRRTQVVDNGYALDVWRRSSLRLVDRAGRALARVTLSGRLLGQPEPAPPRVPQAPPPMLTP